MKIRISARPYHCFPMISKQIMVIIFLSKLSRIRLATIWLYYIPACKISHTVRHCTIELIENINGNFLEYINISDKMRTQTTKIIAFDDKISSSDPICQCYVVFNYYASFLYIKTCVFPEYIGWIYKKSLLGSISFYNQSNWQSLQLIFLQFFLTQTENVYFIASSDVLYPCRADIRRRLWVLVIVKIMAFYGILLSNMLIILIISKKEMD
jgi:hypothetical protein